MFWYLDTDTYGTHFVTLAEKKNPDYFIIIIIHLIVFELCACGRGGGTESGQQFATSKLHILESCG